MSWFRWQTTYCAFAACLTRNWRRCLSNSPQHLNTSIAEFIFSCRRNKQTSWPIVPTCIPVQMHNKSSPYRHVPIPISCTESMHRLMFHTFVIATCAWQLFASCAPYLVQQPHEFVKPLSLPQTLFFTRAMTIMHFHIRSASRFLFLQVLLSS